MRWGFFLLTTQLTSITCSQAKDFADMKNQMDQAHPHAFSLLQWIITSNRSYIVKMEENKVPPIHYYF